MKIICISSQLWKKFDRGRIDSYRLFDRLIDRDPFADSVP